MATFSAEQLDQLKQVMAASNASLVQRVDTLTDTLTLFKDSVDTQMKQVDKKIDTVRADLEKQIAQLKTEQDATRRTVQAAQDPSAASSGFPSPTGAAAKKRKSESLPPHAESRTFLSDEDQKLRRTVVISGFPEGT